MSSYTGLKYKLRASSPIPTDSSGSFVLHSFMAESYELEVDTCTSTLPASSNFKGQGGSIVSASYSRLPLNDGDSFRGEKSFGPKYVEEDNY